MSLDRDCGKLLWHQAAHGVAFAASSLRQELLPDGVVSTAPPRTGPLPVVRRADFATAVGRRKRKPKARKPRAIEPRPPGPEHDVSTIAAAFSIWARLGGYWRHTLAELSRIFPETAALARSLARSRRQIRRNLCESLVGSPCRWCEISC